jgi:Ca2+-binding EF-hand superfamily protein
MTKTHLIALAAAFGLSSVALADDARSFQSLDANNDGYVARDEIPADHPLAANFSAYDTDADGRLSQSEFDTYKSTKQYDEE